MMTMPAANRSICGMAQRSISPPDTEYSIRNPMQLTAVTRKTSGQFRYRILRQPAGTRSTE